VEAPCVPVAASDRDGFVLTRATDRALAALLAAREEQARFGHTSESDRERPPYCLARKLGGYCSDVSDLLLGRPSLEQLSLALRKTARLGALAIALHERLSAELGSHACGGGHG
jgi:hypothetical protein